jgi:hypothetical protein
VGAVHEETLEQNKGCHEWEVLSLSEINTIKSLIKNRVEFDKFYEAKKYETKNSFISNGVPIFYEIIEVTYLDLERLIRNARLTEQQCVIIEYLMHGYDYEWIAKKLGCTPSNILSVFDTACERIKEQNDFEWYEWLETSGKIKVEGVYKQCRGCGRFLKVCENNYRKRSDNKGDGFYNYCRKCEK